MSESQSNDFTFPIEHGHIRQFARAIGDEDAAYVEEGIAPLTFTMAADHFNPALIRRRRPVAASDDPAAVGGRSFHAEQHFTYHRHPRVGENLTVRSRWGRTWEKQGRRGGALQFHERISEYFDDDGEIVITARWVLCKTERAAR